MSRKSRPPEAGKKKGKKGKKSKETTVVEEVVVEERGLPFGVVVLLALAMSLPSLMGYFEGSAEFRPTIVRLLAALLVAWLLCYLVWSVFGFFHTPEEETTITRETHRSGYDDAAHPDPYGGANPYGSPPDPYGDADRRAS